MGGEMTLEQVLREVTQKITCVAFHDDPSIIEDKGSHLAPTGEPFLSLCSGGFKEEGREAPCLCSTAATAISTWRSALFEYAAQKPGILYWRTMPEVVDESEWIKETFTLSEGAKNRLSDPFDGLPCFWVYSRLLISDRHPVRSLSRSA